MKVHCFFEQSGTFRDEFRKLGFESYDYDIDNQFGKTDFQVDLFDSIQNAEIPGTIFDRIAPGDLILAFFPCTYFEQFNSLIFSCNHNGLDKLSIQDKCILVESRHQLLHFHYSILIQLIRICDSFGYRLIVENPYTQPHYLNYYFPFKPAVIDMDRSLYGDFYKKPTQYFFFNFKSQCNFVLEPVTYSDVRTIMSVPSTDFARNLISPVYARHFILKHIVDYDIPGSILRGC